MLKLELTVEVSVADYKPDHVSIFDGRTGNIRRIGELVDFRQAVLSDEVSEGRNWHRSEVHDSREFNSETFHLGIYHKQKCHASMRVRLVPTQILYVRGETVGITGCRAVCEMMAIRRKNWAGTGYARALIVAAEYHASQRTLKNFSPKTIECFAPNSRIKSDTEIKLFEKMGFKDIGPAPPLRLRDGTKLQRRRYSKTLPISSTAP